MRSPIPRFVQWTVVFGVIAALTVAVFQYWNQATPPTGGSADTGWTQTAWGPLGPADRDLLIKVRQAGLWEGPTGQQAQQQASSARVREVGGLISSEHADLDSQVRQVAAQLGVLLPNQPSDQQQGWMAEIASRPSSDFDRTFVQRLRAAHGKVLPVISEVRASTSNDLVRSFATTAAEFVTRHHEYLESTGLVDYSAFADPPIPNVSPPSGTVPPPAAAAPAATAVASSVGHGQPHINQVAQSTAADGGGGVYLAALVYIAALLAIVGLLYVLGSAGLRSRTRPQPRRTAHASAAPSSRSRHAAQRW
ncbi:MAG: DUF4142 domain-containing protein [Pseudonocardiaceae bacterium]